MMGRWVVLTCALLLNSCIAGDQRNPASGIRTRSARLPEGVVKAAEQIKADLLRETVGEFAGDAMEGRGPGTCGDERARGMLVRELRAAGCVPAGRNGSWEQPFAIVGLTSHTPDRWRWSGPAGEILDLRARDDFMAVSGLQQPHIEVAETELVFVGYGIQAPEEEWDDFKGDDLHGKILLMLNDDPDWDDSIFAGPRKLSYGRWTSKYESAARQRAAGAIIIHTTPSAGYPWEVVRSSWSGEQCEVPAGDEPRLAVRAWVTEQAAARLVSLGGRDLGDLVAAARRREFRPVRLGVRAGISIDVTMRRTETANVMGMRRGRDPVLSREVVVYSAHHDHLGIGPADETGDTIYNGARDNGVAVSQLLSIVRAFQALPEMPRRSVAFVFVGAEEQGLLGSQAFVRDPPVPLDAIVADLNLELGNIWGATRDVTIYGMGKSDLEDRLAELAKRQGRTVGPEKDVRAGWYYRSDQYSFARAGIPALWFLSGTETIGRPEGWGAERQSAWITRHYHRPSDQLRDDWDFEGLIQDARLAFFLGWRVAEAAPRPAWYPGAEFGAVR